MRKKEKRKIERRIDEKDRQKDKKEKLCKKNKNDGDDDGDNIYDDDFKENSLTRTNSEIEEKTDAKRNRTFCLKKCRKWMSIWTDRVYRSQICAMKSFISWLQWVISSKICELRPGIPFITYSQWSSVIGLSSFTQRLALSNSRKPFSGIVCGGVECVGMYL